MKITGTMSLGLAVLLSISNVPANAKPVTLAPTSQWHVVYDDDTCRLARIFGADDTKVVLTFEQNSPISLLRPSISGQPVKPLSLSRQGITAAFGPAEKLVPVKSVLPGSTGLTKEPLLLFGPFDLLNRDFGDHEDSLVDWPSPTADQIAKIKHFGVARGGHELVLETGPLTNALQVLGKCTSNLVKTWGLDPDQQATLAVRPQPLNRISSWLRSSDYPWRPHSKGESASIQFRLMVDQTGAPTLCTIQSATRSPDFFDLTCKLLMKRARFAPARDAQGAPVASYYTNSVNWVMAGL